MPEDAEHLIYRTLWQVTVEGDQILYMHRCPAKHEAQDNNQHCLGDLCVPLAAVRFLSNHHVFSSSVEVGDNTAIQEADDSEWDEVGTDEEREDEWLDISGVLYTTVVEDVKCFDLVYH